VLDFVAAMEGCTLCEAAEKLQPRVMAGIGPGVCVPHKELVTEKKRAPSPLGFVLRGVDCAHPYLATRGIEPLTAAHFGVGFYAGPGLLSGRLVIPIHDTQGELIAYCGRSLNVVTPRYQFPPGFRKSEVLFNLHRTAASGEPAVVVVEGFFDCLKVYQAGLRSVVALMGAVLYRSPERALREHFRQVVLMLDGDATGRKASWIIADRLRRHCAVRVAQLPADVQPDQLSAETIRDILGGEFSHFHSFSGSAHGRPPV
jgi:DNA primase